MTGVEPERSVSVVGFRIVNAEESGLLGLKSIAHGLVLVRGADENDWTKVTTDMDYFALMVAAVITSGGELVEFSLEKFPINIRGWQDVGRYPDPPEDPERDSTLDNPNPA